VAISGLDLFAAGNDPTAPAEQQDEWAHSPCIRLEKNPLSMMSPPHACLWSGRAVFSPLSSFIYITRSALLSSSLSVFIRFLQNRLYATWQVSWMSPAAIEAVVFHITLFIIYPL